MYHGAGVDIPGKTERPCTGASETAIRHGFGSSRCRNVRPSLVAHLSKTCHTVIKTMWRGGHLSSDPCFLEFYTTCGIPCLSRRPPSPPLLLPSHIPTDRDDIPTKQVHRLEGCKTWNPPSRGTRLTSSEKRHGQLESWPTQSGGRLHAKGKKNPLGLSEPLPKEMSERAWLRGRDTACGQGLRFRSRYETGRRPPSGAWAKEKLY